MVIPLVITSAKLATVKYAKTRALNELKDISREKSRDLVDAMYKRTLRGEDASGDRFEPLAQSTLNYKTNGKILQESGRMLRETQYNVRIDDGGAKNDTDIYNDTPYAIYHQRGTSTIPQRTLLGVTRDDVKDYAGSMSDGIIDSIFK